MSRLFSGTLYLETEADPISAPDGPGWYVDVRMNQGSVEVAPKVKITLPLATLVATALDKSVTGKSLNFNETLVRANMSVVNAINESTEKGREDMKAQLVEAESLAQRIINLRQALDEFGGNKEDVVS